MKLGGNAPFTTFINDYGPTGGYIKGMNITEKYNTWAAAQYREKHIAACSDPPLPFTPSPPPPNFGVPPAASQTRKSRSHGTSSPAFGSSHRSTENSSPVMRNDSPFSGSAGGEMGGRKTGNEAYFERMGMANEGRRADLPPSQGGKYAGFGSAPDPAAPSSSSSSHPSFALSSHNAPSLQEFQQAPLAALSKGWSLFSSAVAVAGSTINDSVIQPGVAKAGEVVHQVNERGIGGGYSNGISTGQGGKDITSKLFEDAKATGGWLSSVAGEGWSNLNHLAKEKGGLDLNEQLGKLGIKSSTGSGSNAKFPPGYEYEYGNLDREEGGEEDFFVQEGYSDRPLAPSAPPPAKSAETKKPTTGKTDGWDSEWKEF